MTHFRPAGWLLIILVLPLVLAGVVSAYSAEPEVRQGQPKEDPNRQRTFTSPMIMKTQLEAARPEKRDELVSSKEFETYICDNVRLMELETLVHPRKGSFRLSVYVTTYTGPGQDKTVEIQVELLSSEEIIASGTIRPFSAEEKKWAYRGMKLDVPVAKWPTDGVLELRLTMSVANDY